MSETPAIIEFCGFRILPHRRELLGDGQPIRIGGRAFDVLMALIEVRGAVLSKDALMSRVWPNRNVEQNALQAQISALRDLFGADRDLIRASASYLFAKNQVPTAGYAKAFQTGQLNLGHRLNFQNRRVSRHQRGKPHYARFCRSFRISGSTTSRSEGRIRFNHY